MRVGKKFLLVATCILVASLFPQIAFSTGAAEPVPTDGVPDEITLIVPYSAGGGTDATARQIARYLEGVLGSTIVVVNRPGAGGAFGMEELTSAAPTGSTIGLVPYPANVMTTFLGATAYDVHDFDYLVSFTQTPPALVLKPGSPFSDLEELVGFARRNPGEVVASESGDTLLLSAVLLQDEAGIDITTVNYDGAGESLTALLGGHVDAAFISAQFIETAEDQGATAVAIANDERLDTLGEVPTYTEYGYDVVMPISRVIAAPQGLPESTRSALVDALVEVGGMEDFRADLIQGGEVPRLRSGDDLLDYISAGVGTLQRIFAEHSEAFQRE